MAEPAITEAQDAIHHAYRAAAASTVAHARAIADARRALTAALGPTDRPPLYGLPQLEEADLAEFRALVQQLDLPTAVRWTGAQWLTLLRAAPDTLAALLIDRWEQATADAGRCMELHHDGNIEQLRTQLFECQQAHGCWDHTHERIDIGG